MAPHYKTVAQKLKGIATIGAVDCDDSANKKFCAAQGIKGYPTVKLYEGDKLKNPYTGVYYKEATDVPGQHSAKGLHDAATAMLSSAHITKASSLTEFVDFTTTNTEKAKVAGNSSLPIIF